MSDSIFAKITVTNNWEYLTYKSGDLQLDEKRGGVVDVRWPDGTIECGVPFLSFPHRRVSGDHGHKYTVDAFMLTVTPSYHGCIVQIAIEDLEVANVKQ